jgi:hypothetical protein
MRCPSAKRLKSELGVGTWGAETIRSLCAAVDDPDELESIIEQKLPGTDTWVRSLHRSPFGSRIWRRSAVLEGANEVIDAHGVEHIPGSERVGTIDYLNMGDTYAATLIYKWDTDNLWISSWGDVVEGNGL